MKPFLLFVFLFYYCSLYSQDITGLWYGYPDLKTHRLRLNINICQKDSRYKATLEIPDQSDRIYTATKTVFENNRLILDFPDANLSCQGEYHSDGTINGSLQFDGYTFEAQLTRHPIVFNRPQTPHPPFPYISEEVRFLNKEANIVLAGTLTLPANKKNAVQYFYYPAVEPRIVTILSSNIKHFGFWQTISPDKGLPPLE